jgi:formate dehydrogenase subunit gamma
MTTIRRKLPLRALVVAVLLLAAWGGIMYYEVVGADLSNPRGSFWRVVREGIPAYSSTPQQGHTKLIVNSAENWREIRNGLIARISPWIILLALAGMGIFYLYVGQEKMGRPRSGIKIERFTFGDRILHWYTALMFIIMAVTGLSLLLGRIILLPVFGHTAFSWYLQASKVMHNYCGPLLLIGVFGEIILWARFNIPKKIDLQWFKSMGGMIGHGAKPHVEKINGGEKAWFWAVFFFGGIVGVTGVLLDFPIWGQTRLAMQVSHVIHAVVGVLFITVSFGHIYMGTIGVEGAFEGMWTGFVDSVWAQEQHDLWYKEKMRETGKKPGAILSEPE